VTLSRAETSPVTVLAFTPGGGSAVPGSDFYGTTQTVTFAPGQTSASMTVTVLDDSSTESAETFNVRLLNPSGGVIEAGRATMTIVDND